MILFRNLNTALVCDEQLMSQQALRWPRSAALITSEGDTLQAYMSQSSSKFFDDFSKIHHFLFINIYIGMNFRIYKVIFSNFSEGWTDILVCLLPKIHTIKLYNPEVIPIFQEGLPTIDN